MPPVPTAARACALTGGGGGCTRRAGRDGRIRQKEGLKKVLRLKVGFSHNAHGLGATRPSTVPDRRCAGRKVSQVVDDVDDEGAGGAAGDVLAGGEFLLRMARERGRRSVPGGGGGGGASARVTHMRGNKEAPQRATGGGAGCVGAHSGCTRVTCGPCPARSAQAWAVWAGKGAAPGNVECAGGKRASTRVCPCVPRARVHARPNDPHPCPLTPRQACHPPPADTARACVARDRGFGRRQARERTHSPPLSHLGNLKDVPARAGVRVGLELVRPLHVLDLDLLVGHGGRGREGCVWVWGVGVRALIRGMGGKPPQGGRESGRGTSAWPKRAN